MTAPVKRSIQLNIIIAIYFLVSLIIGFSAILFGLQNRMNIDLVENIVVIALLLTFLILVIRWKKIGIYGVVVAHFMFIISCIYQIRSSILLRDNLVYFVSYILTFIMPLLLFIYCKKLWNNFN